MLKKLKKSIIIPSMITALSLMPLSVTNVYAQIDNSEQTEESIQPNAGLTFTSPDEADMQRGTSRPTKVWNISSEGKYNFSGSSHHQTLYSEYKFTGKNNYKVYVNNTGDTAITVTAKRIGKTYAMTKISAGKSGSFEFSNINSDTEFYLVFEADNKYACNGYVK